jgi:putative acetyltransferase
MIDIVTMFGGSVTHAPSADAARAAASHRMRRACTVATRVELRISLTSTGCDSVVVMLTFRIDDLSGAPSRALVARHLAGMHSNSPPDAVHALGIDKLRAPDVTFWSAWLVDELAGCGALVQLDGDRGEIKSMRVVDAFLGRGFGRAILDHIVREARERGMRSLWLETGSGDPFVPAHRLYESAGFVRCGPFDDYIDDGFSVFMTRQL